MKLQDQKNYREYGTGTSAQWVTQRRTFFVAMLVLTCLLLSWGVSMSTALPSSATTGDRYGGWSIDPIKNSDGSYLFCLEPGTLTPDGNTLPQYESDILPGYSVYSIDATGWEGPVTTSATSGLPVQQMNFVLEKYGQSDDRELREATQFAVWKLRGGESVSVWLKHHSDWLLAHGGQHIIDTADKLVAEAQASAAVGVSSQPGVLAIQVNEINHGHERTGTVSYPIGTTVLRITGATFMNGEQEMLVASDAPGTVEWRLVLGSEKWSREHRISASGEWLKAVATLPEKIMVFPPSVLYQQVIGRESRRVVTNSTEMYDVVEAVIHQSFHPVITTQVSEKLLIPSQDKFADLVTVNASRNEQWPARLDPAGVTEFLPLQLNGVLYGPFAHELPVSVLPPHNAPIAATETVLALSGPGSYQVSSEARAQHSGYYYWQWSVDEKSQSSEVRESGIIDPEYSFLDNFGEPKEMSQVAMEFELSTKLNKHTLRGNDLELDDSIQVSVRSGVWFENSAGEPIPIVARMRLFHQSTVPMRTPEIPSDAHILEERLVSISEPENTQSSGLWSIPASVRGWVTIQTCVLSRDQTPEMQASVVDSCDDYGIPDETAQVLPPSLMQTGAEENAFWLSGGNFCLVGLGIGVLGTGIWVRKRAMSREKWAS